MNERARAADWLEVRLAMERVVAAMQPLAPELVELTDAFERTLAVDVISPVDQPPWDNSAMDGYAARTEDIRSATEAAPIRLRVLEQIPAGGFPTRAIGAGEATRIMTGAPVPDGADCVIRIEHTRADGSDAVYVLDSADAGRNIRPRGEDIRQGTRVLAAGRLLRASEIGVLATVGKREIGVYRRPIVAILSTGDELADLDQYQEVVAGRRIVNSNSYALAAAVRATGAVPRGLGIARDNAASLNEHIDRAQGADVLVTTAGASVGDHDLVKDVLIERGYRLDFWRVRMRPGSPFSFGWLRNDDREIPVFGLPGNPVSALVTFELLVRPALRRLMGRLAAYPPTLRVRTGEAIASRTGLTHFLRVRLQRDERGALRARLTGAQGSGLITSMAEADALLVVPEERAGLAADEVAWAVRLTGSDEAQDTIGF